jgi:hypothetical protein
MKNMKSGFFVILLLSLVGVVTSCSGRSQGETKFKITVSAVTAGNSSLPLDGGVTLKVVEKNPADPAAPREEVVDLDANYIGLIPYGHWQLYMVGFEGPGTWSGNTYCGTIEDIIVDLPEMSLNIVINSSNCSSEPYSTMINDKQTAGQGVWGSSLWGSGTWGP